MAEAGRAAAPKVSISDANLPNRMWLVQKSCLFKMSYTGVKNLLTPTSCMFLVPQPRRCGAERTWWQDHAQPDCR